MAKLLFLGVHGSADPTNAAMPFIMANGAVQAGHEAQIVLANEAEAARCYDRHATLAWGARCGPRSPTHARAVPGQLIWVQAFCAWCLVPGVDDFL